MGIFYVVCILRYEAASPPELKHPGTQALRHHPGGVEPFERSVGCMPRMGRRQPPLGFVCIEEERGQERGGFARLAQ